MKLPSSPLKSVRSAAWLSGVLAIAVYGNSLANEFAYDDLHIVVDNESIHSIESLPEAIFSAWWPDDHGEDQGLWRPTSTALFGLQYALWADSPMPYHLVNVVAHGVTSGVVVVLVA